MITAQAKTIGRSTAPPAPVPTPVRAAVPVRPQCSGLKVSTPADAAEKEAEFTAKKIMRMAAPEPVLARRFESPYIARFAQVPFGRVSRAATAAEGQPDVSANINAELAASRASGQPLPPGVRRFMEPRFRADFGGVRIHTGDTAARLSAQLNARAFTLGPQIYFGRDRFRPDTGDGRELIAHELTHTIQQGAAAQEGGRPAAPAPVATPGTLQRSEEVAVTQQSPVHIQRGIISEALDFVAERVNNIPGFRMFTIVLGVNPVNMSAVDRSPANILRAVIEFVPGGGLVTKALDNHGIIDKGANWVAQQIKTLGMIGGAIRDALMTFVKSVGVGDLFSPVATWNRAKRIFTDPIDRIISFAKGLLAGFVELIKAAILRPLGGLAQKLPGYDLLKAVLEKDPVTGDPYPRTPETVIGGFMKLAGQSDVWARMQESRAVPRAWKWFTTALSELVGFVREIPTLFITALKSLEIMDIVLLPNAFMKVGKVFGGFVVRFISWAGNTVWNLLEIIFDVVSPGALGYVKKTGAALKSILKNPLPFVGNLVRAAKLGFTNFAGNILNHLKAGLLNWLMGALQGVYIPQALTLPEIGKFVLSVLGLTWANIRQKLVKAVGETAVKAMEIGFDLVVTLVTQGPAAMWDKIKQQLATLKDAVVGAIINFVIETIVVKAVPKLIAMFIPGAGFISAIISIYDTVMVFVQKISKIIQVVTAFINSIVAIAAGNIGAAAAKVESVLAGLLSLAISFLAGFLGLGNVASKIMGVIQKIRAPIDTAIDWLINWIVTMAKKLFKFVVGAAKKAFNWATGRSTFTDEDGTTHAVYIDAGGTPKLVIATTPMAASDFLKWYLGEKSDAFKNRNSGKIGACNTAIAAAQTAIDAIDRFQKAKPNEDVPDALQRTLLEKNVAVSGALSALVSDDRSIADAKEKYKLEGLTGTYGSMPKPPGDDFTADHQPQAAVLEAIAKFRFFSKTGELAERAAGRARQGYAINLHKLRHVAGATFGSKGKETKESFLARVKPLVKDKPADQQRKLVIAQVQVELRRDVAKMKSVVASGPWTDILNDTKGPTKDLKPKQREALKQEVAQQIIAGENQIAAQDLESLGS
ncbi:MAG TPA: DUF4157 domain-containing protein [Vicinamibacterales bacterium]|nr:DUF4157 domain-containing protein [Vicinamibacterales bacterium]